jgi:hypothetical protein
MISKSNETLISGNNSINNTPMKGELPSFTFGKKVNPYNLMSPFKMQKETDIF